MQTEIFKKITKGFTSVSLKNMQHTLCSMLDMCVVNQTTTVNELLEMLEDYFEQEIKEYENRKLEQGYGK